MTMSACSFVFLKRIWSFFVTTESTHIRIKHQVPNQVQEDITILLNYHNAGNHPPLGYQTVANMVVTNPTPLGGPPKLQLPQYHIKLVLKAALRPPSRRHLRNCSGHHASHHGHGLDLLVPSRQESPHPPRIRRAAVDTDGRKQSPQPPRRYLSLRS